MALPKDAAAVKHQAAKENRQAEIIELSENPKKLRQIIEIGNAIESMQESAGWQLLESWITENFSFRKLMGVFRSNREGIDEILMKGDAFREMQDWCKMKMINRDNARTKLEKEEEAKKKNGR
jgi:hypothetical protein